MYKLCREWESEENAVEHGDEAVWSHQNEPSLEEMTNRLSLCWFALKENADTDMHKSELCAPRRGFLAGRAS